jgi:hypothetical protein
MNKCRRLLIDKEEQTSCSLNMTYVEWRRKTISTKKERNKKKNSLLASTDDTMLPV